ncbi:MAG: carbohydrate binding family 9 domain-containing protein [Acidobacteriia bacterium]|nr:carbohydrate binding family 9 domain-containing protein [Terriglobia bacterium]
MPRVAALLLLFVPFGYAAPPAIQIPRIEHAPRLADFEAMRPAGGASENMLKVSGFIAREPADGAPPTQDTDVYLAYDDHNLYAVFICWDKEPDKIRARMTRREDIFSDDSAEIMIDTFNDARRGYAFAANPLGIQWDALWTEGSIGNGLPADYNGFDQSFDTVWNSEGRLTSQGYMLLMTIPFKSLRFPKTDPQQWRIILNRSIPRTNENLFWPRISNRIQGRFNQAATATGIDHISPARNIQLIPYGLLRGFRDIDDRDPTHPIFANRTLQPEAGLDAKFILHDSFVLDATINPDFSQIESDQPQITVNQRFAVFFPEKRPFFLENSNYFTSPIDLVFTRNIGHPEFGLRLTGKMGPWAVGVLASDDRAPGEALPLSDSHSGDRATFTIARVSRDILDQSTVGAIYTDREFAGGYNRVGGIDANLKLNQHWRLQGQAVSSSTHDIIAGTPPLDGLGYKLDLERIGRKLNLQSQYLDFSPNFETQTGFVNRVDLREQILKASYYWRPEGKFLISYGPTLQMFNIWDHSGTALDYFAYPGFRVDMTRGTYVNFHPYGYDDVRLRPIDYSTLSRVTAYPQPFWGIDAGTSWFKEFDLTAFFVSGVGVNFNPAANQAPKIGHEDQGNFTLTFHAAGRLRIDNAYLIEHIRERDSHLTAVTNHIIRSKWNYQFTRNLSARLILQYNAVLANPDISSLSRTKNFNTDFLITYLIHPGTAIYVGYNSDLENLDRNLAVDPVTGAILTTRNGYINDGRQFFVKASYVFRF